MPVVAIEQRGVDGSIDALHQFFSRTVRVQAADAGKFLTILNSSLPTNNRTFKIASVVNANTFTCEPPLVVDAGPLRWELRPPSELPENAMVVETRGGDVSRVTAGWTLNDGSSDFTVFGRQQFFPVTGQTHALTFREGVGGTGLASGDFQVETAFAQTDVGRPFTISGSSEPTNNGKFEIYKVDPAAPTVLRLHAPLVVVGASNGNVTYTLQPGMSGVEIRHVVTGLSTPLSVLVSGRRIEVLLKTDATGASISTASEVAAIINGTAAAVALVSASGGAGLAGSAEWTLIPGARLLQDGGSAVWAALHFPRLSFISNSPPKGVIEQEGATLAITSPSLFTVSTAKLSSADVGKTITVRGSLLGNDGVYTIASVSNINTANVTPNVAASESGLTWELRTPSTRADGSTGLLSAQSLLQFLAQDFGLTLDMRESEAKQRQWVDTAPQWLDIKGAAKAYSILGTISGYEVAASELYRIPTAVIALLPSTTIVYDPETAVGRAGSDGKLISGGGSVRFYSASAAFVATDVGVSIRTRSCGTPANNKVYTIDTVVDTHTVDFIITDAATVPDYGDTGSLSTPAIVWELVRVYTSQPPNRARFDEINIELMQEIVGPTHFLVDSLCTEVDFINFIGVTISGVSPVASVGVPVFFTVTAVGLTLPGPVYSSCGVVLDIGRWRITDSAARSYYLETIPVQTLAGPPPTHTFQVFAVDPPAVGAATLEYICEPEEVCSYCKSGKVWTVVTETDVLDDVGLSQENAFDRLLARLDTEVKPAHAALVPTLHNRVAVPSLSSAAFGAPTVTNP